MLKKISIEIYIDLPRYEYYSQRSETFIVVKTYCGDVSAVWLASINISGDLRYLFSRYKRLYESR
jgi:hypothetical protein